MKRLATLFLLILFVLPGCVKEREIEIPLPTEAPNLSEMKPAVLPPAL